MLLRIRKLVQRHPYSWYISWKALKIFKFLLPHDLTYKALRKFPRQGLFLDVGANDGISALSVRSISKQLSVFSLEPFLFHQKSLSKLKIKDFSYKMVGAGSKEAETHLFVPSYKGIMLHTYASEDKSIMKDNIKIFLGEKYLKKIKINVEKIKIVTIDSLKLEPTVIKIDAEGRGLEILKGAKETIEKHRPYLMLEIESNIDLEKSKKFLKNYAYTDFAYSIFSDSFYTLENLCDRMTEKNIFFIPDEEVKKIIRKK